MGFRSSTDVGRSFSFCRAVMGTLGVMPWPEILAAVFPTPWHFLVTPARLAAGAAVMPAVLAGGVVGHLIHVDLSERTFQRVVSVALVVLGLMLLTH